MFSMTRRFFPVPYVRVTLRTRASAAPQTSHRTTGFRPVVRLTILYLPRLRGIHGDDYHSTGRTEFCNQLDFRAGSRLSANPVLALAALVIRLPLQDAAGQDPALHVQDTKVVRRHLPFAMWRDDTFASADPLPPPPH